MSTQTTTTQAASGAEGLERVRHLKRGTEYEVLGEAEAQVSYDRIGAAHRVGRPLWDENRLTFYRCVKTGKLWCRFTDEFRDGRFETIATASQAAPVAWAFEYCVPNGEGAWEHRVEFDEPREGHWLRNVRPLFETPQPAQQETAPQPAGAERVDLGELADGYVQRVAEWDDRTSPEDWPEAMLITGDELKRELLTFAAEAGQLVPASLPASLPAVLGSGEGTAGACLTAPGSCPSGDAPGGSSSQATAIPSRGPAAYVIVDPEGVPYWPSVNVNSQDSWKRTFTPNDKIAILVHQQAGWRCLPIYIDAPAQRTEADQQSPSPAVSALAGECPSRGWPATYQETFDAIGAAVTWYENHGLGISVKAFYAALGIEARQGRDEGSVEDEGPVSEADAPHPQSPSLSEVEEARALLAELCRATDPRARLAFLRNEATDLTQAREYRIHCNRRADAIEAALATLTASQEQDGGGQS